MKVKLNETQMDYLNSNFFERRVDLNTRLLINRVGNCYLIDADELVFDEIRDWVNLQLQLKGFDENYELTKEGEILGELSDISYV